MMCLFSVIIPVFNTKTDYLKKCIESVKTQSFNDYEILVINDGSNRESTNKYIEYLKDKNDNKIKIFEQSNKGVSSARNLGIRHSKGKYIMFLDSDDFLNVNCFSKLSSVIKDNYYDILFFKYQTYFSINGSFEFIEDSQCICTIDSKEEVIKEIINPKIKNKNKNINYGTPWGKIIKRELIVKNQLRFEEDLPRTQDRVFMFDCCVSANNLALYNYTGYIYNSNEESVCSKHNKNLFEKLMRVYDKFIIRKNKVNIDIEKELNCLKTNFYFEVLATDIFHKDNKKSFFKKIKEAQSIYINNYSNLFYEYYIIKNTSKKRKIFLCLFRIHLNYLVYIIYYLKNLF